MKIRDNRYKNYLDTATIQVSRYYALPNEPALITCSFPNGGADLAPGKVTNEWEKLVAGYFSEPFTGIEHHVAATLISQGMVDKGLMIEDAVHRRYAPEKRNPYNEIEYGNHYIRAMSGLAPFISASGFTYNGPKGEIGFDPKIDPDNFKSAFITGESWGSFSQKRESESQINILKVEYGILDLTKIILYSDGSRKSNVNVKINGKIVKAKISGRNNHYEVQWSKTRLKRGDELVVTIKLS